MSTPSSSGATMQIYFHNLPAIQQQTRQLDHAQCKHCKQTHQLISHGFVRKKRVSAEPEAVGKRVFCSNRHQRTGCGRTMQLYVDATIRYLHHAGQRVVAFMQALTAGNTIHDAYQHATGSMSSARHAYRWLHRLTHQLSSYRSGVHRPPLQDDPDMAANRPARLVTLTSTFTALLQQFGQPLCCV